MARNFRTTRSGSMTVPTPSLFLALIKTFLLSSALISKVKSETSTMHTDTILIPKSSTLTTESNTTSFRTTSAAFLTITSPTKSTAVMTTPIPVVEDTSILSISFTYAMPVNLITWNATDSFVYSAGVAEVAGVPKTFVHPQYPAQGAAAALRIRTRVGVPRDKAYYDIIRLITFDSLNAVLVRLGFPKGYRSPPTQSHIEAPPSLPISWRVHC